MKTQQKFKFYIALVPFILMGTKAYSAPKKTIEKLTNSETASKTGKNLEQKSSRNVSMPSSTINVHSLGIGIGQSFLKGDFENNGNDKITFDLYYNYSASYSFDFVANFHTSSHEIQDTKASLTGLAVGIKGKAFQFDSFSPFALGGLGFYSPKLTRRTNGVLEETESKIVFGTHFGAGVDLRLNRRVTTGIIAHYHNPFDAKQDNGSLEVEGSYFKLLITALYSF